MDDPFIPDIYIVSGEYAWFVDESGETACIMQVTQDGTTFLNWGEIEHPDSRGDVDFFAHSMLMRTRLDSLRALGPTPTEVTS